MTPRMQNLLSVGALVAAFVITLLPEGPSTSQARTAIASMHVSQIAR